MQTYFRGTKNNKPPSTWKTGITRQKTAVVEEEEVAAPTIDLSKMQQELRGSLKREGTETQK